jgi:hypothetical protein
MRREPQPFKIDYGAIKAGNTSSVAEALRVIEQRVVRGLGGGGELQGNLPGDVSVERQEGPAPLLTIASTPLVVELAQQAQHQPLGTVTISGGTGTPTATFQNVDGIEMDDAANEGVGGSLPIPVAWRGMTVSVYMTWAHSDASATGNVVIGINALLVADGEDDTGSYSSLAVAAEAAASGGDNEDAFRSTKLGTFVVGETDIMLIYHALRYGSDIGDNFAAKIWAYNLLFINDN